MSKRERIVKNLAAAMYIWKIDSNSTSENAPIFTATENVDINGRQQISIEYCKFRDFDYTRHGFVPLQLEQITQAVKEGKVWVVIFNSLKGKKILLEIEKTEINCL